MTSDKKTVLFVDDHADDLAPRVVAALPSFEVIAKSDPFEALEEFKFGASDPDLILLDVNFSHQFDALSSKYDLKKSEWLQDLPDVLGGIEALATHEGFEFLGIAVLASFRRMHPDIPIAMITAYDRWDAAFRAGQTLATAFYSKNSGEDKGVVGMLDNESKGVLDSKLQALLANRQIQSFDHSQKSIADEFADSYREKECYPGTVAYWKFEDEKTQRLLGGLAEGHSHAIQLLEVGVGDGRCIENLRAGHVFKRLSIAACDYSGGMLLETSKRAAKEVTSGQLKLRRCAAERLPFEDESFHFVIAAFGFLSYVKIDEVLDELYRVTKPGGTALLSTYNYDALFYERWNKGAQDHERPIGGMISRDTGLLEVGGKMIKVRPMRPANASLRFMHAGFEVQEHWTFPTLYSFLSQPESQRRDDEPEVPIYDYRSFSGRLYDEDVALSEQLKDRGYYSLHHCLKPKSR